MGLRLTAYAEHLVLVAASAVHTDVAALAAYVNHEARPGAGVVFVDTVERVPVAPELSHVDERVRRVLEALKDLAVTHEMAFIGIMSTAAHGLCVERLGLEHLVAPATVASVADAVVLLNRSPRSDRAVWPDLLTVAKNRNGPAGIDVPFPAGPRG